MCPLDANTHCIILHERVDEQAEHALNAALPCSYRRGLYWLPALELPITAAKINLQHM